MCARSSLHRADRLVIPDAAPEHIYLSDFHHHHFHHCQHCLSLSSLSPLSKAPLLDEDEDDMEECEGEDDGAADDVEPGVHRVQHLLKGRAGKKGVIWCIAMVSKGHQKICAQKPTFVKIRFQKGSPETCQGALGRAVVVGVVGEEGQVLAVEGELAGVVEEAVGSHQSTWEREKN